MNDDLCPGSAIIASAGPFAGGCPACGRWTTVTGEGRLRVHRPLRPVSEDWTAVERPRREKVSDITLADYNANPRLCPCGKALPYRNRLSSQIYCSSACRRARTQLAALCVRNGITVERFSAMYEEQGGRCAICRIGDAVRIDRDRECCGDSPPCGSCVRGLLCTRCCTVLSIVRGDTTLLRAAATYVAGEVTKRSPS